MGELGAPPPPHDHPGRPRGLRPAPLRPSPSELSLRCSEQPSRARSRPAAGPPARSAGGPAGNSPGGAPDPRRRGRQHRDARRLLARLYRRLGAASGPAGHGRGARSSRRVWSLLPDAARAPYLAQVVAPLCGPPCRHVLMLVSAQASGTLPAPVTAALTAAGLVGSWVGWRWAERAAPWGLLLMAAGAAAGLPADLGAGRWAHRSCAPRPGRACCEAFQRWPMVGA